MNMLVTSSSAPDGIVLFAHGSRDPLWRGPIEAVAQRIRTDHPSQPVACAYLELCEPSLPDAVAQMLSSINPVTSNTTKSIANYPILAGGEGLKSLKIRIVPMFLGMGKHAREDLPELATQLRAAHPQVEFEITATVGEDERVTQLLAELALS
jgi:sirohydrochlorin cobaltochelatase